MVSRGQFIRVAASSSKTEPLFQQCNKVYEQRHGTVKGSFCGAEKSGADDDEGCQTWKGAEKQQGKNRIGAGAGLEQGSAGAGQKKEQGRNWVGAR